MKRILSTGLLLAMAATLSGCGSSVTKMTCEEYGKLSIEKRDDVHEKLLKAHDLDPDNADNAIGLSDNLSSFCGTYGFSEATQNLSRPIDDAVNWDSDTW